MGHWALIEEKALALLQVPKPPVQVGGATHFHRNAGISEQYHCSIWPIPFCIKYIVFIVLYFFYRL